MTTTVPRTRFTVLDEDGDRIGSVLSDGDHWFFDCNDGCLTTPVQSSSRSNAFAQFGTHLDGGHLGRRP